MTPRAALSAAVTMAVLAAAWFGWGRLGTIGGLLGLGWLEPLPQAAGAIAALSLLDVVLSRFSPSPDHR